MGSRKVDSVYPDQTASAGVCSGTTLFSGTFVTIFGVFI